MTYHSDRRKMLDVTMSKEMLIATLSGILTHTNGTIIAKSIIDNLEATEMGISNLMHSLGGIELSLDFYGIKIGDLLTMEYGQVNSWDCDDRAMRKAQIILNDQIECLIIGFDYTKKRCIQIEYSRIEEGSTEVKPYKHWINPNALPEPQEPEV